MANRGTGKLAPTRADQARRLATRASALRLKLTEHLSRGEFSATNREGVNYIRDSRTLVGAETQELISIVWELAGIVVAIAGREPERIGSKEVADGD